METTTPDDNGFNKRRPVPILTRENQEVWFRLMKIWLIGDGLWTGITEPTLTLMPANFDVAKDARAQYHLVICIGPEDRERTADLTTAKDIWTSLWKKYKNKLKFTGRQYVEN